MTRLLSASTAAVALTFAIGAAPALADSSSVDAMTYTSAGDGLTGVVPDSEGTRYPAMSYILDSDGQAVNAFCVQFKVPVDEAAKFTPAAYSSSSIANLAKAADIAARHNSIGTPYTDARWEAAATQTAIWVLTDGVDPAATGNAAFATRVNDLVAGASAMAEPAFTLNLATTFSTNDLGEIVASVTVTASGSPVGSQTVRVVSEEAAFTGVTDSNGVALVTIPARFAGKPAVVSAQTVAPAGVFLSASSGQSLVTASAAPVTSKTSVTLPAAPAPTPTPQPPTPQPTPVAPTPVPSPSQVVALEVPAADPTEPPVVETAPTVAPVPQVAVDETPKELPKTGSEVSPFLVFGLLALGLAGGIGFFLARRHA